MITNSTEMPIMMMPKAESLPHRPSLENLRICTAMVSVPGLDKTTERESSLKNMVAIRIHPDTMPGISKGITIRRIVVRKDAPHTVEDSSR